MTSQILGYVAAILVLAAFTMRSNTLLRTFAILSNLSFIGYAYLEQLLPVMLLHGILLPINIYRLTFK